MNLLKYLSQAQMEEGFWDTLDPDVQRDLFGQALDRLSDTLADLIIESEGNGSLHWQQANIAIWELIAGESWNDDPAPRP